MCMRIDLFFSQRRVHLLKKNYLESDLTSKESSELSEDAGPRVGVGAVSCSVACHVTESCFIPLPVVEWSMSKDFSPLAGEIILDNLQTLRCTITGLTTVRVLLIDVPIPCLSHRDTGSRCLLSTRRPTPGPLATTAIR